VLLPLPDMETDATRTRIDAAICRALRLPAIDSIRAGYSDRNTHNSGHTTTDGSVTSNSPPTIDAHQPRQHLPVPRMWHPPSLSSCLSRTWCYA
jgi:hypothetical protein